MEKDKQRTMDSNKKKNNKKSIFSSNDITEKSNEKDKDKDKERDKVSYLYKSIQEELLDKTKENINDETIDNKSSKWHNFEVKNIKKYKKNK
jgi:hypothetical protein